MNRQLFNIGFVAVLLLTATMNYAQDWTRFRGPEGKGIVHDAQINLEALKGAPHLLWETYVGMGHGTLVIADGRLYTSGNQRVIAGADTVNEDIIYCLDAVTGDELWHYAYPCADRAWPGPRTTPTLDDGLIYNLSWEGDLFALNMVDGRVAWKLNLIDAGLSTANRWGFSGSPVVEGDVLYLNAGKSGAALNKKTGTVIWQSEAENFGLATPVLYDWKGQRMGLFSGEREIHAVDIQTGKRQWSYAWKTCNDPQVIGDRVLLTGDQNRKQSCLLQMTDGEPTMIWESRVIMDWAFQNVVIKDNHAYGFGHVRRTQPLQCFDLSTGELKWQEDLGDYGAFVLAGDQAVILDGDGDLVIAELSPEKYTEQASTKVLMMAPANDLPMNRRNFCWTEPVLHQNKIYVRGNYGNIACVNLQP